MDGILFPYVDPTSRATDLPFPLDNTPLSSVPNDTLASLLYKAPALHDFGQTTVVRLSQTLVLKGGGNILPPEAAALRLVASSSSSQPDGTIRAPRVHRAFQIPDDTKYFGTMGYLVMDYIPGRPLDTCWASLPRHQQTDIARQVAAMVLAMQRVQLPAGALGPIGNGHANGNGNINRNSNDNDNSNINSNSNDNDNEGRNWPSRGRFFTHYSAGPFGNPDVPAFRFTELVLVHQDISPRNLVLDGAGQVWLVDWADAGAYPRGFETAALRAQASFPDFHALVLERLERDFLVERQLGAIEYGWLTAALA
ncbi:phosphotransferase family protein [Aspergillus indologenus CBS 114.80]|uniref:Phosphotransferase family protein n=1 Tax=Aspergillus indologenus CBS 114.80 TaxID=1450541 RepID=A0A2V5J1W0_9EURO|nr:phosphotransferase family protein [Aspergillus indologenus CBS 114.80]